MVTTIRGFSSREINGSEKRSLLDKILGRITPAAKFVANFETVQSQVDKITGELLTHEHNLLKDIRSLDALYDRTLDFYDELALYIAAGDEKIKEFDEEILPALRTDVESAPEDEAVIRAQELRDMESVRGELDKRVHDLRLTRQVTMQSLPSIRLVQENDKSLVAKINSTLVNTVPLWETQLAQAITIQRGASAAKSIRAAGDLTNELLTANAKNLRQANAAIRTESERGVFDVAAIKKANTELIATIEDSLRIANDGKAKRAAAEADLRKMEDDLKNALSASKSKAVTTDNAAFKVASSLPNVDARKPVEQISAEIIEPAAFAKRDNLSPVSRAEADAFQRGFKVQIDEADVEDGLQPVVLQEPNDDKRTYSILPDEVVSIQKLSRLHRQGNEIPQVNVIINQDGKIVREDKDDGPSVA